MLRKARIALAIAAIGLAAPTMALARGGGGGGGGHGGGFAGAGFSGGGFHGGGFSGRFLGFGPGPAVVQNGGGFHGFAAGPVVRGGHDHEFGHRRYGWGYGNWPYWDDYAYYDYPYYDSYYDSGSCYVVNRRVRTMHGWRTQPSQVCG